MFSLDHKKGPIYLIEPYLTLYMSTTMSRSLLYNLGRLALSKSSSYVSEWDLYLSRLNARSCIRSTFLLSDDLQKCHIRWQYVRWGKIKASYSNSLALDGIKCLKRDSIPTFWLVLLYSSLICFF